VFYKRRPQDVDPSKIKFSDAHIWVAKGRCYLKISQMLENEVNPQCLIIKTKGGHGIGSPEAGPCWGR